MRRVVEAGGGVEHRLRGGGCGSTGPEVAAGDAVDNDGLQLADESVGTCRATTSRASAKIVRGSSQNSSWIALDLARLLTRSVVNHGSAAAPASLAIAIASQGSEVRSSQRSITASRRAALLSKWR